MHLKKTQSKRNSIKPFIKTNDFRQAEVGWVVVLRLRRFLYTLIILRFYWKTSRSLLFVQYGSRRAHSRGEYCKVPSVAAGGEFKVSTLALTNSSWKKREPAESELFAKKTQTVIPIFSFFCPAPPRWNIVRDIHHFIINSVDTKKSPEFPSTAFSGFSRC